MEGKKNLYFALGELAYAVAKADGQVQKEEKQKLHDLIVKGTSCHDTDFDISEIIFHLLHRDNMEAGEVYDWAINEMRRYKQFLTEDMKVDFVGVIEKVARAFDPVTVEEAGLIDRLRADLDAI